MCVCVCRGTAHSPSTPSIHERHLRSNLLGFKPQNNSKETVAEQRIVTFVTRTRKVCATVTHTMSSPMRGGPTKHCKLDARDAEVPPPSKLTEHDGSIACPVVRRLPVPPSKSWTNVQHHLQNGELHTAQPNGETCVNQPRVSGLSSCRYWCL